MYGAAQKLASFAVRQFKGPGPIDLATLLRCPPLEAFYESFNGGYFWNRALLVRAVQSEESAPSTILEWNNPELWKNMYGSACLGVMFFAEDAFGVQFGIQGDRVVQFDPETASISDVAETLDKWCDLLVENPDDYTGAPVLAAWERKNSPIQVGYRLIPKQLFMLGGEFHSNNMACKTDLDGLRVRAQFWELTRDLPEGQKIIFKIED